VDEDAFRLGFASEPTSTAGAQNYGVSANWYLNRNFKFMLGYERTWFDTPVDFAGPPRQGRRHPDAVPDRVLSSVIGSRSRRRPTPGVRLGAYGDQRVEHALDRPSAAVSYPLSTCRTTPSRSIR
jgi:hypothetical protein